MIGPTHADSGAHSVGLRVPALAVVDSRNVIHQAEDVLGHRRRPTVAGVIDALSLYGYDVLEVHVGLALACEKDREALSRSHAENLAYLETVEAHPRGRVLEGELHRRPDGRVEEKMVDVACAVEVARHATLMAQGRSPFRAVVVLSADRDLTPAYRMAVDEYGVALHVAAASIVETREHPYLLLGQAAFARMCEPEPAIYGHALRNAVARLACEPRARWTLVAQRRGQRGCLMRHESGALGWVPANDVAGLPVGAAIELFSRRITGPEGRSRFPLVRLSAQRSKRRNGLAEAVVEQRLAPRRVRVRLADGSVRKAWCEIGGLVRGTEVLLQTRPSRRVIGCLDDVPPLLDGSEAIDLDTPRLVRVLSVPSKGRGIGIDEKGRRCTILADTRTALEPGRRIAAMPIDLKRQGRERLIVQAISSALPPDR